MSSRQEDVEATSSLPKCKHLKDFFGQKVFLADFLHFKFLTEFQGERSLWTCTINLFEAVINTAM
jgi:hypothetical protein